MVLYICSEFWFCYTFIWIFLSCMVSYIRCYYCILQRECLLVLDAEPILKATDLSDNNAGISVMCRIRPFHEEEEKPINAPTNKPNYRETCVELHPEYKGCITVYTSIGDGSHEKHEFCMDHVFGCEADQSEVYEIAARPVVESVLEGFNGTLLAYGQTSSGKTYTMQGDVDSDSSRGIAPRMVETIFEKISQTAKTIEFTIKVSMLEIYNEKVKDLLNPSKGRLKVRKDKSRGVYVKGLTEVSVGKECEVHDLIKKGNNNRAVVKTATNVKSSRSHSIIILTLVMNDLENKSHKTGKLYLVDLVGSETISEVNASVQTLEETKNINRSLTTLSRVIHDLTSENSSHIPYKDSKLTRILQGSLGGSSNTCLIVTVSPLMENAAETLSTCRFGARAKEVKKSAKVKKQTNVLELKSIVTNLEKELSLRNERIERLEGFLANKGYGLDVVDVQTPDLKGLSPIKVKEESTDISIGADIVEQLYDKQKEELKHKLDALLNELIEERGKLKASEEKLEAAKAEHFKQLQEKEIQIARLKKEMADSLAPEKSKKFNEARELLLKVLLASKRLSEKAKKFIGEELAIENSERTKEFQVFLINTLFASAKLNAEDKKLIAEELAEILSYPAGNFIIAPDNKVKYEEEIATILESNQQLKLQIKKLRANLSKVNELNKKLFESSDIELLKSKVATLEESVEWLVKHYDENAKTIDNLKLNIQMKEKELKKKIFKIEEYEKQIGGLRKDLEHTNLLSERLKKVIWENVPNAAEILSQPLFANTRLFYVDQANLVRDVRGDESTKVISTK